MYKDVISRDIKIKFLNSILIFLYLIIKTIKGGKKATDEVWEGAEGLEWTLSSPPPYHSFNTPPVIK